MVQTQPRVTLRMHYTTYTYVWREEAVAATPAARYTAERGHQCGRGAHHLNVRLLLFRVREVLKVKLLRWPALRACQEDRRSTGRQRQVCAKQLGPVCRARVAHWQRMTGAPTQLAHI